MGAEIVKLKIPLVISLLFHAFLLFNIMIFEPSNSVTLRKNIAIELIQIEKGDKEAFQSGPILSAHGYEAVKSSVEAESTGKAIDTLPVPISTGSEHTFIEKVEAGFSKTEPASFAIELDESSDMSIVPHTEKAEPEKKGEPLTDMAVGDLPEPAEQDGFHLPHLSESDSTVESAYIGAGKAIISGIENGVGSDSEDEMAFFKAMVRHNIENAKFYPHWARKKGFEGMVGVRFTILSDGNVGSIEIIKPCHCDILNKAARDAIEKAAPFRPLPSFRSMKSMVMEIDIGFKLRE